MDPSFPLSQERDKTHCADLVCTGQPSHRPARTAIVSGFQNIAPRSKSAILGCNRCGSEFHSLLGVNRLIFLEVVVLKGEIYVHGVNSQAFIQHRGEPDHHLKLLICDLDHPDVEFVVMHIGLLLVSPAVIQD